MEPITVDFANFATGDDDARLKISQDLVKSLREYGTARLLNCGVPEQVSASYLDLVSFCRTILSSLVTVLSTDL